MPGKAVGSSGVCASDGQQLQPYRGPSVSKLHIPLTRPLQTAIMVCLAGNRLIYVRRNRLLPWTL
jgi:hypothetical protein